MKKTIKKIFSRNNIAFVICLACMIQSAIGVVEMRYDKAIAFLLLFITLTQFLKSKKVYTLHWRSAIKDGMSHEGTFTTEQECITNATCELRRETSMYGDVVVDFIYTEAKR